MAMADEPRVDLRFDGPVAILSLSNPPGNRLTQGMIGALASHAATLQKSEDSRAVVLTGAGGRTFCEGLDEAEWAALSPKDAQAAIQKGFEALWALEHLPVPTIAAIEGTCRSVGAELALACDLRFAAESARFGFPEAAEAWMPSHGGTARLPRMIGRARALELLLSGRDVDAQEAAALGFVERVTRPGETIAEALAAARSFAAKPPAAVRAVKRTLTEGEEKPYRNRFLLESQHSVQLLWTEAYREAREKARKKTP